MQGTIYKLFARTLSRKDEEDFEPILIGETGPEDAAVTEDDSLFGSAIPPDIVFSLWRRLLFLFLLRRSSSVISLNYPPPVAPQVFSAQC